MGGSRPQAKASPGVPDAQEDRPRSGLNAQLAKTKLCAHYLKGSCQYGRNCSFAHSCAQLQASPDLRKTRLCAKFFEGAGCTDRDCLYAHSQEDLRSTHLFYRKTLCIWNEKGKCRNGQGCRFAHGTAQLRREPARGQADPRKASDISGIEGELWARSFARQRSSGDASTTSGASTASGSRSVGSDMPMKVPTSGVLADLPVGSPAEHLASLEAFWEELQQLQHVWQQEALMSYLFDSWERNGNEDMSSMFNPGAGMMPMCGGPYPFTTTSFGVLPPGQA